MAFPVVPLNKPGGWASLFLAAGPPFLAAFFDVFVRESLGIFDLYSLVNLGVALVFVVYIVCLVISGSVLTVQFYGCHSG